MTQNVTTQLDGVVLKKCRAAAMVQGKSLSQWISDELVTVVSGYDAKQEAKDRALRRLQDGFSLGGVPLSRAKIYAE